MTPGRVGLLLVTLFALWVGSSFATKMVLAYRLNAQVSTLRRDNQQIADANRGYAEQLRTLSNPAGEEEVARQHNYTLPNEKVYVVVQPSPSPSPSPHNATAARHDSSQDSAWTAIWNTLTGPFRH